jgi:hypothetical protein
VSSYASLDFEKKLEKLSHKEAIEDMGGTWHIAGHITSSFLKEFLPNDSDEDDSIFVEVGDGEES